MLTALMTSSVIPWSSSFQIGDIIITPQVADINIGILFVFGVISMGVYGILLGAWASNNKFSLLAAIRASSQIISYELAFGVSLIALLMLTGTLSIKEIVENQVHGNWWNVVYQPLGFLLFFICAFAECNRAPFDLPESENELVGGYHSEYSSMKLGFFLFAEYINMFISSAVMTCLFFGGYDIPFLDESQLPMNTAALLGLLAMMTKIFIFLFIFLWVRWTVPRFRYDQLMNLGWKKLFPLALINMIITGIVVLLMNK